MKWSVIIPTLWKPKTFPELLERLQNEPCVDEILIIDNAPHQKASVEFGPKIIWLEQPQNIFVNPAWNLGVERAKMRTFAFATMMFFSTQNSCLGTCEKPNLVESSASTLKVSS